MFYNVYVNEQVITILNVLSSLDNHINDYINNYINPVEDIIDKELII